MGVFAETFGIRPWEWDQMDAGEVLRLISYVDQMNARADG